MSQTKATPIFTSMFISNGTHLVDQCIGCRTVVILSYSPAPACDIVLFMCNEAYIHILITIGRSHKKLWQLHNIILSRMQIAHLYGYRPKTSVKSKMKV